MKDEQWNRIIASKASHQLCNIFASGEAVADDLCWRGVGEKHPDLLTLMMAQGMPRQRIELFNESLTPAAAAPARKLRNAEFGELVTARMESSRMTYDTAFKAVSRERPELIGVDAKSRASFTNKAPANPVAGPATNALLGLPASASQEVFDVAFKTNRRKFVPVLHGDVFNALIEWKMSKSAINYEMALVEQAAKY